MAVRRTEITYKFSFDTAEEREWLLANPDFANLAVSEVTISEASGTLTFTVPVDDPIEIA